MADFRLPYPVATSSTSSFTAIEITTAGTSVHLCQRSVHVPLQVLDIGAVEQVGQGLEQVVDDLCAGEVQD